MKLPTAFDPNIVRYAIRGRSWITLFSSCRVRSLADALVSRLSCSSRVLVRMSQLTYLIYWVKPTSVPAAGTKIMLFFYVEDIIFNLSSPFPDCTPYHDLVVNIFSISLSLHVHLFFYVFKPIKRSIVDFKNYCCFALKETYRNGVPELYR
jgi:hypothetical protein